jgi:protein gp37
VKKFKPGDKVFVGSWMDFFHPGGDDWRSDAWDVIRSRPDLIWQIVTKRPENMKDRMPSDWGDGWPNVWLIATTENQETADKRIPILLDVPAVVHGVSVEPMLDAVILAPYLSGLDWVICGGESGPGARPMELSWAYNLKDQCKEYSKPFFFKQTGAALAKQLGYNDRKFGGDISEFPESLRVREYPHQGD